MVTFICKRSVIIPLISIQTIILVVFSSFSKTTSGNSLAEVSGFVYQVNSVFDTKEPFFPLVYTGNGIDQMNINLVYLKLSGLMAGDEIGVFDSIYCVGSAVITELDMQQNSLSIQASANDRLQSDPNGFIQGHIVTLKMYRLGVVYPLHFQLVNDSKNLFIAKGSMFVIIDFLNSTQSERALNPGSLKIFPNPFTEVVNIEIDLQHLKKVNCELFNSNGKLVKSLINEPVIGKRILIWDGKNDDNVKLNPGIYYLRANDLIKKIMMVN